MKHAFTLIFILISVRNVHAQQTEYAVQLSSGLFKYGGESAVSNSYLFISDIEPHYNVNSPFGKKSGLSYGLGLQAQRVTKKHFLWGLRLGYDRLTATTKIDNYTAMGGNLVVTKIDNGKARLSTNSARVNPYFGYRINAGTVNVDLNAGLNLAYILKSSNYVTFDNQNDVFARRSDFTRVNTKMDFGPTAGVAVSHKRLSLFADYFHGLINYQRMMDGANPRVYSRYLRFGIGYRIF